MIKEFLEIGQIVGTHGVRGEVRVNPLCDSPDFLKGFKTLYFADNESCAVRVRSARPHGNVALLCLEGIDTVEAAQSLRGKILFMKRTDAKLKKGSYFIAELIGCEVFDADCTEKRYGVISDVSRTGANDVWHIKADDGKEYLLPSIPDVVIDVNVEENTVIIRPLKGIFDDEN